MTVHVFVWEMLKTGVGHASLHVSGGSGEAYVSWWPAANAGGKSRAAAGIASPGLVHSMHRDKEEDGTPDWCSKPLTDLDEGAIVDWWSKVATTPNLKTGEEAGRAGHYVFLSNNCSTSVMRALLIGADNRKRALIAAALLRTSREQALTTAMDRVVNKLVAGVGTMAPIRQAIGEAVVAAAPKGLVIAPFDCKYVVERVWG